MICPAYMASIMTSRTLQPMMLTLSMMALVAVARLRVLVLLLMMAMVEHSDVFVSTTTQTTTAAKPPPSEEPIQKQPITATTFTTGDTQNSQHACCVPSEQPQKQAQRSTVHKCMYNAAYGYPSLVCGTAARIITRRMRRLRIV